MRYFEGMRRQRYRLREGKRVSDPIIERILRETGVPELFNVLAERLNPADLQSLLLAVYQRRAAAITPSQLLERYEQDRFVRPSTIAPQALVDFERLIWSTLPDAYTALDLAPVCPLGTNAAIATVSQNKVVTTIRNSEVVADITNVLALECASRRRQILRVDAKSHERVRLCASHRVIRGQAFVGPASFPHFRLLGLCCAGRDEGSFRFETSSLVEQIAFYMRLFHETTRLGYHAHQFRIAITDLEDGQRTPALEEQVLAPLVTSYPDARCELDPDRATGRGYYVGASFHIYSTNAAGIEFELVDGGFTTWTQQLINNRKERLLISGLGVERFCAQFRSDESGPVLSPTS
jgi:hypothetical protein